MSDWATYRRQPEITFTTPAPEDAPEIRGYRAYFKPEWLEWTVRHGEISVIATGPATRAQKIGRDSFRYDVESGYRTDNRPPWLLLPIDLLAEASLGATRLTELLLEAGDDL